MLMHKKTGRFLDYKLRIAISDQKYKNPKIYVNKAFISCKNFTVERKKLVEISP